MINILLTGSTGQVGSKIKKLLIENKQYKLFLPIRKIQDEYEINSNLVYFYFDMNSPRYYDFFKEIDIFIHAATAWEKDSISVNVDCLKFILDSFDYDRIKKILILTSASIYKNDNINPDCLSYGTDYIKSKYLQYLMVENHKLFHKSSFLFLTMVIDHKDRLNQIPFLYHYEKYFPKKLPENNFHMIRSEDIAATCFEIMKLERSLKKYVIGLPKTNLSKFFKENKINNNGWIPFFIIKFILNFFCDSWTYYNINYFLDQSYDVVNPKTFGLKILYNYSDIINKPVIRVYTDNLNLKKDYFTNEHYSNLELVEKNKYNYSPGCFIILLKNNIKYPPDLFDKMVINYRYDPSSKNYYDSKYGFGISNNLIKNLGSLQNINYELRNFNKVIIYDNLYSKIWGVILFYLLYLIYVII